MATIKWTGAQAALDKRQWRILLAIVCLAVLVVGVVRQVAPQPLQGGDFIHTFNAAQAVRQGQNLYAPAVAWVNSYTAGSPLENQYFYAPTFAMLLAPLTLLPYQVAYSIWGLCIVAFLFFAVYSLLRATGSRPSALLVLVLVTLASLMAAVRSELILGQANLFMVACVCAALWARQSQRPVLAGVLLGLAFVTKPMLLLILVFLLWKREFKLALATVGGFLGLLLLPFLWLGASAFGNLLTLWHFYSNQYLSFSENIAPRGLLERALTINPFVAPLVVAPGVAVALWLVIVGVLMLVTLAVIAPRQPQADARSLLEIGTMISALMLISPLTESTYFVFLLVPWIASFTYLRSLGSSRPSVRWAALCLLGLWLLAFIPRHAAGDLWYRLHMSPLVTDVVTTLAPGLLILVGTFVLQLYVLGMASGRTTGPSVRHLVRHFPALGVDWLKDFGRYWFPAAPVART